MASVGDPVDLPAEGQQPQGCCCRTKEARDSKASMFRGFRTGHDQYVLDNPGNILDFYDLEKDKLGEGSSASVFKARSKSSGAWRAVKNIAKSAKKDVDRFKQEIAIMKMMDHPNIIKLYETFEDYRNVYMVMELCNGGDMFDRISAAHCFTEVQAATLMQQIMRGVYYMHEHHVAHRDLKPENFLFLTGDAIENDLLKIIDFGLSCKFAPGQVLHTKVGTPYYVAPDVLTGTYDHLCDMWSCGVIMFVLLCGYPPFFAETDAAVLRKVTSGSLTFKPQDWDHVSEDAKALIRMLLNRNPQERCSAEQALRHEWIRDRAAKAGDVCLPPHFFDSLRGFRSMNKLKKAALHVIAGQLNEDEIKALREVFTSMDGNGDGLLSTVEMKEGLEKSGLKEIPPELQQIMEDVDEYRSGAVDYTDFLAATLDRHLYLQEDICWSAFRLFDKNGDGRISREELAALLNEDEVQSVAGSKAIAEIMKEVDKNSDGFIDFEEFMSMMREAGGSA